MNLVRYINRGRDFRISKPRLLKVASVTAELKHPNTLSHAGYFLGVSANELLKFKKEGEYSKVIRFFHSDLNQPPLSLYCLEETLNEIICKASKSCLEYMYRMPNGKHYLKCKDFI